jgi:hypothetical protein
VKASKVSKATFMHSHIHQHSHHQNAQIDHHKVNNPASMTLAQGVGDGDIDSAILLLGMITEPLC